MTCDRAQEVLSASFDGEAETVGDERAVAEARRHADGCAGCARFARHALAARALLRPEPSAGIGPSSGGLAAAVLAQVRREDAETPRPATTRCRSCSRCSPA